MFKKALFTLVVLKVSIIGGIKTIESFIANSSIIFQKKDLDNWIQRKKYYENRR